MGGAAVAPLSADAGTVDVGVLRRLPSLREWLAYPRAAGVPWYGSFWAVSVGTLLAVAASIAAGAVLRSVVGDGAPWFVGLIPVAWAVLAVAGFVGWLVDASRRIRIARFALANGYAFADRLEGRRRPGLGFPGHLRNIERGVIAGEHAGTPFQLGRNQSVARRDAERADLRRPFVFLQLLLPTEVPHLVLKNRRSRVLPIAGLGLGNATRLSLEGDFDRTFTLLCPADYERDALYILTPNLMAALLETASDAEVEFVDDRATLYFGARTALWKPETMRRVFGVIEQLGARLERQTSRYDDDRAAASATGVALGGRRILGGDGASGLTIAWFAVVIGISAAVMAFSLLIAPTLGG